MNDCVAMNGNDPLTQKYLSMSEEPAGEHLQQLNQRPLSGSSTDATMQILPNCTSDGTSTATGSGELYEGDDELGEDTSLAQSHSVTQTGPEDTEGEHEPPSSTMSARSRIQACNSSPSQADDEEDEDDEEEVGGGEVDRHSEALDFVHVHLDHLPSTSRDENNFRSITTQNVVSPADEIMAAPGTLDKIDLEQKKRQGNQENQGLVPNIFSFYRKFASEGSAEKTPPSNPEILKSASNASHKYQHQRQLNTSIRPTQSSAATILVAQERPHLATSASDSKTYHRQHPNQHHPLHNPSQSPTYVEQRQKALQGDLVYTDSGKGESGSCQTEDDSIIPHLFKCGSRQRDSRFEMDPQSHFDFVNMNITDPLHSLSTTTDTSVGRDRPFIGTNDTNATMSSNDRRTRYEPPNMTESNTQNVTDMDFPNNTIRGDHFGALGIDSYNKSGSDLDHNYSQAISQTSEGDEDADDIERGIPSRKQHKDQRKERLLTKKQNMFRMTLLQTMHHNTRANFCAIFLLGVAMATLVLLVVAKVSSNSHEDLIYDDENGEVFVVTNNERLMTIEVLAFALIMVLLFGSVCYLATATCNTNNSLVRIVKHEDAYLANSSSRRRETIYNPHVQNANSIRRSACNMGWSSSKDVGETYTRRDAQDPPTDTDQQSNAGTECQDLQNHTYSMMSSGSQADERTNDDENDDDAVLVSMDEADRTSCCSPFTLQASTEDLEDQMEDQMEDERLASQDDEDDHEGSLAKGRCGVLS